MNAPCSVLRAIFETVEHDQSRLLVEVQRGSVYCTLKHSIYSTSCDHRTASDVMIYFRFDGAIFQVTDEIKEQAKKW